MLLMHLLKTPAQYSLSERRKLEQAPSWSIGSFLDNTFTNDFEAYTMDQFPFRDSFRRIKALNNYYIFMENDVNGIYLVDGYAAKLNYPLNEKSVGYALDKFKYIYNEYLSDKKVNIYTSVIPDKGYFAANQKGYPAMDYEKLFSMVLEGMDYATFIDISESLTMEDYYKTDTHWRQEKLESVVQQIGDKMGISQELKSSYEKITTDISFYGVYYGQTALPLESEPLYYLTNDVIRGCTVFNYETGKTTSVYDLNKLEGNDPYDVFLSGATSLLTVDNPLATTQKELILFRDSYGGSIAPLLLSAYQRITLVDIRYISSEILEEYIEFHDQDVLFLYSSLLLNDSYTLK